MSHYKNKKMDKYKDIINREHPKLVENWGESAQLLSFNQVITLMDIAVKEDGNWFTRLFKKKEPKLSEFTKWEIFKEGVSAVETTRNSVFLGNEVVGKINVTIDIYRRYHRESGEPEYKNVKII